VRDSRPAVGSANGVWDTLATGNLTQNRLPQLQRVMLIQNHTGHFDLDDRFYSRIVNIEKTGVVRIRAESKMKALKSVK